MIRKYHIHTADQPMALLRKSHRTLTAKRHQEDNYSKATSSLFPIKAIATLEGHNTLNNKTRIKHKTLTKTGVTMNQQQNHHNSTTAAYAIRGGDLNAFYWYQTFALDLVTIKYKKMFSLHGGFLSIAMYMYHHRAII